MSRHNRERRTARTSATPKQPPAYFPQIIAAHDRGEMLPGRAYIVTVRHAEWCALLTHTRPCDCTPDVGRPELVPAPEDN